jgi:hypothetical protein
VESLLASLGLNQYQRAAQLNPALLTVLPATVTALMWAPKAAALLGSLASIAATGALVALLMQYGRAKGRAVQARLTSNSGGLPTTRALRHRDEFLANPTRLRYHSALRKNGLTVPTPEEEASEPAAADAHYRSAVDWLLEHTRDEKKYVLLHLENRSYGFRRNLLGLKPTGLTLTALSFIVDVGLVLLFRQDDPARTIAGAVLAVALAAGVWLWLYVVDDKFVEDASSAYATRLLAACEDLPG